MATREELEERIRALEDELELTRVAQDDASTERLHILLAAEQLADVGSWVWDLGSGRVSWSRQLYRIFGRETSDVPSVELFDAHVHPDDRARIRAGAERGMVEGVFNETECRIVRRSGEVREVLMRGMTRLDPSSGAPIRVYGVIQDITERAANARERAQLEAQLRQAQKMDALGRLASGVAHDVNNMLAIMLMSVDNHRTRCGASTDGSLDDAVTAMENARDLTHRLLSFARQSEVKLRPTDVGALVSQSSTMLRRLLKPPVQLETDVDVATPLACADARLVEQALVNLVINARDAMPEGGTITVSVRGVASAPETLQAGPYVLLEIADDGSGMSPAVLDHAIEPFFTTKPEGEGTGLGLSMVYGAVTALRGHVGLFSALGQGTRVSLFFQTA